MNEIDKFLKEVSDLLEKSSDPFAKKYKNEFFNEIKSIAQDNWMKNGEPSLTPEQMSDVYEKVKEMVKDKSWEILCGFNICLN